MSKSLKERIIRGSRRSPRVIFLATKVTPEFDALLRQQAHQERYTLAEMLEKYQESYQELKLLKQKSKKIKSYE
jgi:hypothetical protein